VYSGWVFITNPIRFFLLVYFYLMTQTTNPKFQRTIENFSCEQCGFSVEGNGYTNHCPKCLWSKHVDINPGDRAADCKGLMEPTHIDLQNGDYVLTHTCVKCKHQKQNRVVAGDDFDTVVSLAVKLADTVNKTPTNSVVRAPLGAGQQMIGNLALN
jgi:Zn finger protein HypA/HybF involved in hydrogenase expression